MWITGWQSKNLIKFSALDHINQCANIWMVNLVILCKVWMEIPNIVKFLLHQLNTLKWHVTWESKTQYILEQYPLPPKRENKIIQQKELDDFEKRNCVGRFSLGKQLSIDTCKLLISIMTIDYLYQHYLYLRHHRDKSVWGVNVKVATSGRHGHGHTL